MMYHSSLIECGEIDINEDLLLKKVVNSYHLAPCFLLIIDDIICGMAGFTAEASSHNGVVSMIDYMFYVKKEHRSLENLSALVKEAKDFANEKKMPIKVEFKVKNNDEELRKRLLVMHGFEVHSVSGIYNYKGKCNG